MIPFICFKPSFIKYIYFSYLVKTPNILHSASPLLHDPLSLSHMLSQPHPLQKICSVFSSSLKGSCYIPIISVALMLLYPWCCVETRTTHSSQDVDVPRYHILASKSLCLVFSTFLDNDQNFTGWFWLLHIHRMTISHCTLNPLSSVVAFNSKFSIEVIWF